MKIKSVSFLLHIAFLFFCTPCFSVPHAGYLWKVTGRDMSSPSYILGTEGTTSVSILKGVSGFKDCWDHVSQVMTTCSMPMQEDWTEKEFLEYLTPFLNHKESRLIMMNPDTTYEKLYTNRQIAFIDSIITRYMPPLADIHLVPIRVWKLLMEREQLATVDKLEKNKSILDVCHEMMDWMNIALERNGRHEGKSYQSLEDVRDEMNATAIADSLELSCFTLDEQALIMYRQMLYKASHPLERTSEAVLKDLYKQQDFQTGEDFYLSIDNRIDSLGLPEQLTRKLHETSRKRREIEIENRSRKWLRPILSAIRQTPTLIAVDIKSLYGDESLLNLLRGVGYAVEPVMQE